ncbi:thiopeptide-type bacteriocin biosynthesis protein [Nonomuraea sp. SYSU D8015]|uniref:thiopeptide-type bacteriocin biosynthesis protein n=1 Tax=Nonomuraea sp. SYSU D8015 TaxID=2593644 RepID=UPI0016605E9A|nr:thiopeptide-type bacteriocin biosynthesis protein [Nonomuraea sp. SYSU D8015]
MGEDQWVSAHIFYHGDQDRLILRLVRQIVDDLAGPGFFFLRYWEAGPHVRLRVRAEPPDHDRVRRLIEERCRDFFHSWPSANRMSQAEYEQSAPGLARAEQMMEFAHTLAPNNSISFIPYRREYRRYGHPAMAAVEEHFVDSSRIVLAMIEQGITDTQRVTVGVALYLIVGLQLQGPVEAPQEYAEHFARQRDILIPLGRRLRALLDHADRVMRDDGLAGWSLTTVRLRKALQADHGRTAAVMTTCAHLAANRLGIDLLTERYVSSLAMWTIQELREEERWA